jgi:hypothetical protein
MTKLEVILMAALRLLRNNYRPWETSGGPNQCVHGIMKIIACRVCDEELVSPYMYFKDQLPKPTEMAADDDIWPKWENDAPPVALPSGVQPETFEAIVEKYTGSKPTTYGSLFGGSRKP